MSHVGEMLMTFVHAVQSFQWYLIHLLRRLMINGEKQQINTWYLTREKKILNGGSRSANR